MFAELDDDFFYEEDKIVPISEHENTPLLRLESPLEAVVKAKEHDTQIITEDPTFTLEALDIQEQEDTKDSVAYQIKHLDKINWQKYEIDRLGMHVTTGTVTIIKDQTNLIGISIGGGAPLCPCLYIVQVFDGTPAAREGSLESGDELLAVNSVSVKGKTKVDVAKLIQATNEQVVIHYNKLHADPAQGKSLDIILKKFKHRLVDSMSSNTADSLGLSRAILCNDSLVKRLEELEGTEIMYEGLVDHAKRMLKAYFGLLQTYKSFGDCFTQIGTHEPQKRASEVFRKFGEFHRTLEKDGVLILKQIKPILDDLRTYLKKAIPDTKLTVNRYMDAKFTYLSYCLKIKEMDDEEHSFAAVQEPLYRVETGNYEYRLILRCRQDARAKFAGLRTDVLEKMELLECKHANDLNKQLRALLQHLAELNRSIVSRCEALPQLFPIEVDFKDTDFQYKPSVLNPQEPDDDDDDDCAGAKSNSYNSCDLCAVEAVEETPAQIVTFDKSGAEEHNLLGGITDTLKTDDKPIQNTSSVEETEALLKDLGLFDVDLTSKVPKTENTLDFDLFLNQSAPSTILELERDLMANNAQQMDLLLQ